MAGVTPRSAKFRGTMEALLILVVITSSLMPAGVLLEDVLIVKSLGFSFVYRV